MLVPTLAGIQTNREVAFQLSTWQQDNTHQQHKLMWVQYTRRRSDSEGNPYKEVVY